MNTILDFDIATICKGCVHQEHPTCKLDLLDKYAQNGGVIIETMGDDNIPYNIVGNRICLYHSEVDIPNIREQIKLKYDVVIYVNKDTKASDIIATLQNIKEYIIQPVHIYIANHGENGRPSFRPSIMFNILKEHCSIPWRVENIIEEGADYRRSIDICMKKVNSNHVIILHAGKTLPSNYIENIDFLLNDELEQIVMVTPDSDDMNGLFISTVAYKNLSGNNGSCIEEKVRILAERQQCQKIIRTAQSLL